MLCDVLIAMAPPVRDVADLERLLQAERQERLESVQTLQRDVDCQQKLLTQLTEQVLCLQRMSPVNELSQVCNRVAALEALGGHPKLAALDEAVTQLNNRLEMQQNHMDLQASALCEGLTEMHVLKASLSAAAPVPATEQSADVEELLNMTSELARVLEVEREARKTALTELDERLTADVDECLHVKDAQALFETWERSGVDKYGRVSSELAEMWDILEARLQEGCDRMDRVELHLFRETQTPRTQSSLSLARFTPRSSQILGQHGRMMTPRWRSDSSDLGNSRLSMPSCAMSVVSAPHCGAESADAGSEKFTPRSDTPVVDTLSYVPTLDLGKLLKDIKYKQGKETPRDETPLVDTLTSRSLLSEVDVSCTVPDLPTHQEQEPRVAVDDHSQESSTTAESAESQSESTSEDEKALAPVEKLRVAYRRLQAECEAACRHAVKVTAPDGGEGRAAAGRPEDAEK